MTKSDEKDSKDAKSSEKSSEKNLAKGRGAWIDQLFRGTGRMVRLETRDGVQRSGRMTGLRSQEIVYNGVKTDFVTEVELNGDPSDTIPIGSMIRLDID